MNMESLSFKRRIYRKICYVFGKQLPDILYLKLMYQVKLGEKLNLKNPDNFNEKLNWLKLYDRKECYTTMADKYLVREYVAEKIGEEYLIPLLGVYRTTEEIDFEQLPNQFVLKCTHDSASVVICKNKQEFDIEKAKEKLSQALKINYFYPSREWPYKDIVPRIIAEKYMSDESGTELKDYKIYNFGGKPKLIQVDFGRFTKHERNLYTIDWEYINQEIEYPTNPSIQIEKPKCLDEMLKLAEKLAVGLPSIRTDFYVIEDKVYFGEITFYQEGGFARFSSQKYRKELGDLIVLPDERENR